MSRAKIIQAHDARANLTTLMVILDMDRTQFASLCLVEYNSITHWLKTGKLPIKRLKIVFNALNNKFKYDALIFAELEKDALTWLEILLKTKLYFNFGRNSLNKVQQMVELFETLIESVSSGDKFSFGALHLHVSPDFIDECREAITRAKGNLTQI